MREYFLKSGEKLIIKEVDLDDAEMVIDYVQQISLQSEMITISPGEFNPTIEEEREFFKKFIEAENQIYLIGMIHDKIVSVADISASQRKRIRHIGTLGISTHKTYWGKGIGRYVMEYLLDWVRTNQDLSKIHLTVRTDNTRAIKLYQSLGFQIEGTQKNGLKASDGMYDVHLMGLILA